MTIAKKSDDIDELFKKLEEERKVNKSYSKYIIHLKKSE